MKKFLLHTIVSKYKLLRFEKFKNLYEQINSTNSTNVELLYLRKSNNLPIDFKYYAFIVIILIFNNIILLLSIMVG